MFRLKRRRTSIHSRPIRRRLCWKYSRRGAHGAWRKRQLRSRHFRAARMRFGSHDCDAHETPDCEHSNAECCNAQHALCIQSHPPVSCSYHRYASADSQTVDCNSQAKAFMRFKRTFALFHAQGGRLIVRTWGGAAGLSCHFVERLTLFLTMPRDSPLLASCGRFFDGNRWSPLAIRPI